MKLILALLCISMLFVNIMTKVERRGKSHSKLKTKSKHLSRNKYRNYGPATNATATNSTAAATNSTSNATAAPAEKKIPTIPFGPAAVHTEDSLNSLGSKVSENVILTGFPFKIQRCDSIVYFPCAYINNLDDYRVRKSGYASITAHYTNLYADKDGQKLIQQVLHSLMPSLPAKVGGAEGCVRVSPDKGQKTMIMCVPDKNNAENLLQVYKDFARCRIGDNLKEIPAAQLKKLMSLCGVNKNKLLVAADTLRQSGGQLPKGVQTIDSNMVSKVDNATRKHHLHNIKNKKKSPEFEYPNPEGNKWEKQRLSYFHPGKLSVPGGPLPVTLPAGIQPGLNPVNNPGTI